MPRFPKLVLAVLAVTLLVAAGGCRKKRGSTTYVSGEGIFTTDDFPGGAVQDHNVADDARAMSPSGQSVAAPPRFQQNGRRGAAIVVYDLGASGLYAQHFDGETWTPPVSLGANDMNPPTAVAGTAGIAFLNTEDHPSDTARERDGDAVIIWEATDFGAVPGDGPNVCLFSTYFNVSMRDDPAANYGFQPFADRISTLEDDATEDIISTALVSDGLCGEARWSQAAPAYDWGDLTTGLAVAWIQAQDNDPAVGFQSDWYLASSTWDLAQPGDTEVPLLPGPMARLPVLGFGASDTGLTSEETTMRSEMISYNNTLLYVLSSRASATSAAGHDASNPVFWSLLVMDTDVTVQALTWDLLATSVSAPVALVLSTPDSSLGDSVESQAAFVDHGGMFAGSFRTSRHSVYGSDEGLSRTLVLSLALEDPDHTDFGEPASDGRLLLSEIDPGTGALLEIVALDAEDDDISDSSTTQLTSRISRNGDYIWVAFSKPADLAPTGPSADDHYAVWATQILPPRLDDEATPQLLSQRIGSPLRLSPDILGGFDAPSGFQFQAGLGYVCGVQSDPDVMNFFFEHSDGSRDVVHHARLVADLDAASGVSPAVAVAPFETFLETELFTWFSADDSPLGFVAADSGDDGHVVAFYFRTVSTSPADVRVFARRSGPGAGVVEIGSAGGSKQGTSAADFMRVAVTPPGEDIGRFDPSTGDTDGERAHPASAVHVFFHESKIHVNDGYFHAIRTRRFEPGTDALAESFVPSAGAEFLPPFQIDIDVPWFSPFLAPTIPEPVVSGDRVGLWFLDHDHIYYQEFDPDGDELGWSHDDGAPDPFLVDDDTAETVVVFYGVALPSCGCDTLEGAIGFWLKQFSGSGSLRLQCRVRNGD
jgi:hypothetical protein